MPFDPQNPIEWINEITQNDPQFIRCLCKSLYWESHLVRLPARAILCNWGMTSQGRVGVVDENDPETTRINTPPLERMLRAGDPQYDALVRQEDPEAGGTTVGSSEAAEVDGALVLLHNAFADP